MQSSPIAENGDIVVFGDIAENGDILSPFSAIFHLPFYFGGYQGVHWKTRVQHQNSIKDNILVLKLSISCFKNLPRIS